MNKDAFEIAPASDEIREVYLRGALHGGAPAGFDAIRVAKETFAEAGI